ncbi:hypothetical protein G6O69_37565 [Pseudenhygromyxa sp. WMMC2535]|uniref:hypothetical protein n=1 Tax=Pseudenhygromyxa sp. WMMC2535 TaxID=2712867 RepID=UPI00155561C3|nr:hypothetical protein [Pseudenhygromyxa sp. WMMC2535]NVB38199.1 hypothetical protein [Pseudenhygromyxa sp. WMMC2535]NVB43580.1 hypothetical protein [Pseudenhygromyxa sp. WMMC2535]
MRAPALFVLLPFTLLLACKDQARERGVGEREAPAPTAEAPAADAAQAKTPGSKAPPPALEAALEAPSKMGDAGLEDFPIALPAAQKVTLSDRRTLDDGREAFTLNYEAVAGDPKAVAAQIQAEFEAAGLAVERKDFGGDQGEMISLAATRPAPGDDPGDDPSAGAVAANATIATTRDNPAVTVVIGWHGPKP